MEENTKYNLPIKIAIDSTKENETLLFDSSVNSVAKKVESSPSSKSEKSIIKNTSHSSKEKEDDKQKIIIKKSVYIKDTMYLPN